MAARREIHRVLALLGDANPIIRRTLVRGIIGVKTNLNVHVILAALPKVMVEDLQLFRFTQRWIPVDTWSDSDIASMKKSVKKVADIRPGERWKMVVEKRRYQDMHTDEIIRELAELVEGKVDLKNPNKIVRIDILGKYAGISLLEPGEVFSSVKLPRMSTVK